MITVQEDLGPRIELGGIPRGQVVALNGKVYLVTDMGPSGLRPQTSLSGDPYIYLADLKTGEVIGRGPGATVRRLPGATVLIPPTKKEGTS